MNCFSLADTDKLNHGRVQIGLTLSTLRRKRPRYLCPWFSPRHHGNETVLGFAPRRQREPIRAQPGLIACRVSWRPAGTAARASGSGRWAIVPSVCQGGIGHSLSCRCEHYGVALGPVLWPWT